MLKSSGSLNGLTTKKPKKKKEKTKTQLRKKCDKLFGELIRSRGHCEWCGRRNGVQLQTAHIITRDIRKLRFEEKNVLCLCASCHRKAHDRPLEFAELVKKIKGIENYKWLIRESQILEPLTEKFYEDILKKLGSEVEL